MTLKEFFSGHNKLAVAFSGGTDSAYLLYMAKSCGADVTAIYIKTAFQPEFELEDARRFCEEYDIRLTVIEYNILDNPIVTANPSDRCYHCKISLFKQIIEAAHRLGYEEIADGTNASDDADDRPGMKALKELGILSPLRLCDITKDEIRSVSRRLGLFTADKPAYACLATRIPTETRIKTYTLSKIEFAESALHDLGFSDFRIRCLSDDTAKLEVKEDQLTLVLEHRTEILDSLSSFFNEIYLNLKIR